VPDLLVVLGSATPPGRLHALATAGIAAASRPATLLDLAQVRVGPPDGRALAARSDDTANVIERIAASPGVVFVTPVYRGSFTGTLKNLLDLVPVEALRMKPVGILAMGASQHHYLGADRHLRDVLAFFGAVVAPVSVYVDSSSFADGVPDSRAIAEVVSLLAQIGALADSLASVPAGPVPLAAGRA